VILAVKNEQGFASESREGASKYDLAARMRPTGSGKVLRAKSGASLKVIANQVVNYREVGHECPLFRPPQQRTLHFYRDFPFSTKEANFTQRFAQNNIWPLDEIRIFATLS
jgi:hypothetical protein